MPMVPDITAGPGTESDETPGWWWPVGLSQSEGAHEMAVSVDGALFRVPGHLGVGRPSIYTTAFLAVNPANFHIWPAWGHFPISPRAVSETLRQMRLDGAPRTSVNAARLGKISRAVHRVRDRTRAKSLLGDDPSGARRSG